MTCHQKQFHRQSSETIVDSVSYDVLYKNSNIGGNKALSYYGLNKILVLVV
jgi:hypothetical protein